MVVKVQGRYELTWKDIKAEFSRKYFPREALDQKDYEFMELRQRNMIMRENEVEFDRLSRFSCRFMDEDELIQIVLRGA